MCERDIIMERVSVWGRDIIMDGVSVWGRDIIMERVSVFFIQEDYYHWVGQHLRTGGKYLSITQTPSPADTLARY